VFQLKIASKINKLKKPPKIVKVPTPRREGTERFQAINAKEEYILGLFRLTALRVFNSNGRFQKTSKNSKQIKRMKSHLKKRLKRQLPKLIP